MHAPSFAFFGLILILLLLIPGTILGWVAAGRIRRSEGQLYGLRLAVFAGMFFPTVLLLVLPFATTAIMVRVSVFSLSLSKIDGVLLAALVFASSAFLSVRIFQASLRGILGKRKNRELFRWKKNRVPLIVIALLWIGIGVLFFLQRPRQIDELVTSESKDQMYQAKASTWHQMQAFGSDRVFYRFKIRGKGGAVNQSWDISVPTAELAKDYLTSPISDYWFEENGSIRWGEANSKVEFIVSGVVVFQASLDQPQNGARISSSGGNIVEQFGGVPHVEALPK